jgi:hypothetical protein
MKNYINIDKVKPLVLDIVNEDKYSRLHKIINKIGSPATNPYQGDENIMWQEQCYLNFPILYLSSIYLYLHAKRQNKNLFLFCTRDGCHWHRIFSKMFPNEKVCYFDCSRVMFDKTRTDNPCTQAYIEYVKGVLHKFNETVETSIYVDIHGQGHRMFSFFKKWFQSVPDCFLLTARFPSYDKAPLICQEYHNLGKFLNISFEMGGGPIEMLNYDLIGTLRGYEIYTSPDTKSKAVAINAAVAIRDKLEYKKTLVLPYHAAIEKLIEKTQVLSPHRLCKYNIKELDTIIKKLFNIIGSDRPIIAKRFTHLTNHLTPNTQNP